MNDDLVVQKILKLLENNTAFIGYALNGGIGTKINVRNTETGKTIQALSINVDSTGEVLVVKDSEDGQYKAVNFKTAEKVSEKIIQLRKTKPIDDKKIIEYTDSDIEVFYLFVKLIDTGVPVSTNLKSTWIRKGNSCTQFVGAYERCNFGAKEVINGVRYSGLPYIPHESLESCLNDDGGRDARTPNGSKDDRTGVGSKLYVTKLDAYREGILFEALTSHDTYFGTNYRKSFGYGTTVACTGTFDIMGYAPSQAYNEEGEIIDIIQCVFGNIPNPFSGNCSMYQQSTGFCSPGYISNKAPNFVINPTTGVHETFDNSTAKALGWDTLPFEFMYAKTSFSASLTSFGAGWYLFQASEEEIEQILAITPGLYEFVPYCPQDNGGPYNGEGFEDRVPENTPIPEKKRNMKLSTHKAEIWLGSSKKEKAIKLYELGVSDLFSSIYSPFITRADETRIDVAQFFNQFSEITEEDKVMHEVFYNNRDKNTTDLLLNPNVWVYILDNQPRVPYNRPSWGQLNPKNLSFQYLIDSLYNRTINLTILDKDNLVVHLKLGLKPSNTLNNNDCAGNLDPSNQEIILAPQFPSQSWEYQKYVTIKINKWQISSTSNTLDLIDLDEGIWNKLYIERKFLTSFGEFVNDKVIDESGNTLYVSSIRNIRQDFIFRTMPNNLLLRPDGDVSLENVFLGNNFEQYNYSVTNIPTNNYNFSTYYSSLLERPTTYTRISGTPLPTMDQYNAYRYVGVATNSWWALWDKSHYNSKTERFSSIVGYEKNLYQVVSSWKLSSTLDYSKVNDPGQFSISQDLGSNTYFEYLPSKPLVMIPSIIKSVRDKRLTSDALESLYKSLTSRDLTKSIYGLNFYFSDTITRWTDIEFNQRTDNLNNTNSLALELPQMLIPRVNQTRELNINWENYPQNINCKRIDTTRWINNLWAQFLYMGEVKVDIDSYKQVKFTLPINPSQYIKFAADSTRLNNEFSFTPKNYSNDSIIVQSVLSPGVLDVTKQVTIKKPTNVDLDPNMSFLVYLYPNVTVTKKSKEI